MYFAAAARCVAPTALRMFRDIGPQRLRAGLTCDAPTVLKQNLNEQKQKTLPGALVLDGGLEWGFEGFGGAAGPVGVAE